jgi:hypothetical protein
MDVRTATGVETYVNDEPNDPNPGIIVDSSGTTGKALTSAEARALAIELLQRADYFDTLNPFGVTTIVTRSAGADGAVVVFIDTDFEPGASDGGPGLRVRINDDTTYAGVAYEPREEDI